MVVRIRLLKSGPKPSQSLYRTIQLIFRSNMIQFNPPRYQIAKRIFIVCLSIEISLVLMEFFFNLRLGIAEENLREVFDLAEDHGIGGWFAVVQTMMVGMTLLLMYFISGKVGNGMANRLGWMVLAVFFIYMSADDAAMIHESLGSVFGDTIEDNPPPTDSLLAKVYGIFPSYGWLFAVLPFFIGMGLFMVFFMWQQTNKQQKAIMTVAVGVMAIAVGLDFLDGFDEDDPRNIYTLITDRWDIGLYTSENFDMNAWETLEQISRCTEEFLEMLSITLLWVAFVLRLEDMCDGISVRFAKE